MGSLLVCRMHTQQRADLAEAMMYEADICALAKHCITNVTSDGLDEHK